MNFNLLRNGQLDNCTQILAEFGCNGTTCEDYYTKQDDYINCSEKVLNIAAKTKEFMAYFNTAREAFYELRTSYCGSLTYWSEAIHQRLQACTKFDTMDSKELLSKCVTLVWNKDLNNSSDTDNRSDTDILDDQRKGLCDEDFKIKFERSVR